MNLWIDTKYRSNQVEIMDDLEMKGDQLKDTLDKIATINKRLGGNNVTLNGIKQLIPKKAKSKEISIIDLGCGNGDMLRAIANYGRKAGLNLNLMGIDANECTINYAEELSKEFDNIKYRCINIFSKDFEELEYDIALATLFLHHFNEKEINSLVRGILTKARIGIVVNDLHRHKLAYYLFKFISLFISNSMVKYDGLISILRGFRKEELTRFARNLNYKSSIRWKWAFRYQWLIKK